MRAPRNSLLAQLVAVAWVRGWIDNACMRAIAGCSGADAGARIRGAIRGGHLVELPGYAPKRWCLSPHRLDCIASMPNLADLRVQAEQTTQRIERITRIQIAQREARRAAQTAARPGVALVAKPLPSVPAPVTLTPPRVCWADMPVQDPHGLLARREPVASTAQPIRLRGGLLAPADGPYIRPGALAALALP